MKIILTFLIVFFTNIYAKDFDLNSLSAAEKKKVQKHSITKKVSWIRLILLSLFTM